MTRTDKLVAAPWGGARVRMTDGRPALVPIAEDLRPSERMADYLAGRDGAERLLAPKVREGYLRTCREGRDPALTREDRGREAFVEVEWEEALELAARAIERTYADHGPSAVWGRSYGWKNTGEVNNPIGLLRRLLMLKGGFVQTFNSYSTAAIAAIQKVIAGSGDPDVPPAAEVLEHAERVILWGADPVVTNDIAWTTTLHDTAKVFEAMRTKEGLEVVAVEAGHGILEDDERAGDSHRGKAALTLLADDALALCALDLCRKYRDDAGHVWLDVRDHAAALLAARVRHRQRERASGLDGLGEARDQAGDRLGGGGRLGDDALDVGDELVDGAVEDGAHQGGLVREVVVQRALGHLAARRDLAHLEVRAAALDHEVAGGGHDPLARRGALGRPDVRARARGAAAGPRLGAVRAAAHAPCGTRPVGGVPLSLGHVLPLSVCWPRFYHLLAFFEQFSKSLDALE